MMVAILSEIMDRLQDLETAREKANNGEEVHQKFESLYDFVAVEEYEAKRIAWFKRMGVLS